MKLGHSLIWSIAAPITLVLLTSGCASKKYVRNQVGQVNQKVATAQKQTNEKIAAMWNKEESDISQVNERISTTDQKVAQLDAATQEAQGTASRAMEGTETNTTAITNLGTDVTNSLNYQLVEKTDVMFAFNKATLTPQAMLALDQVASKSKALPRSVIELTGFTDTIGTANYNLELSRKRAWAVQRYLVNKGVPVRSIHIVGMGKENPPPGLEADLGAISPNPSKAQLRQLERRVRISIYGAGEIGAASRSERLDPSDQPQQ
jgi:OmpA-OmpF porin, OOP family